MSEFQERDSGWTLCKLLYFEVNINKYNPMSASSFIDLLEVIKLKRTVINVQNNDQACFAWSVTSALCTPVGLPQRISSYPSYETVADFSDMSFPVKLKDINIFEIKNNMSINVYGLEKPYEHGEHKAYEVVGPLYFSKQKRATHINLLLVSNADGNTHYCWIKNLSRLVSKQKSLGGHEKYICEGCLISFTNLEKLRRHEEEDCTKVKAVLPGVEPKTNKYGETMPENILQYDKFERQLRIPYVIYADFETVLKPIETTEPNPSQPYTVKCYEHEPHSFAYYLKCCYDDSLSRLELYRGENAGSEFIRQLGEVTKRLYKESFSKPKEMNPLTDEDIQKHEQEEICHICDKPIVDVLQKVCDHDHMTGAYRGPAHMICNINFKEPRYIPIIFHNLSNYDSHLFVKTMALEKEEVEVIAQNKEKYISFSKKVYVGDIVDCNGKKRKIHYKLRFIDSFNFMSASLDKLSSDLEDSQCKEIARYFADEKFKLLRQKGVIPYNFVTSFEKLNHPHLPSRDEFYDKIRDSHVSVEDYSRARRVWDLFECETLGQYSDLYLLTDVLLLADVFENFRDMCLSNYKLDPAHYFTAPGLSWGAMLRMTGVKLEVLTDIDMLNFLKMSIHGGVSMCSKRKEIANNIHSANYDETKPNKQIVYLDATNLYGHAMCFKLPVSNFAWLTQDEVDSLDVNGIADAGDVGYVLEVDLEYPTILHDYHNDFPFCPESVIPPNSKFSKLIPNLCDKTKYVMHYLTLKQCLRHGLILRGIRRGIKFRQEQWLKNYIDFNTAKRNESTHEFGNQFYKLQVNSIFGKTMENVENRVDIKLLTHWESRHRKLGAEAYVAKPNFKSSRVFSEFLVAIELALVRIQYMKPVYIGFVILEIAKMVMYDFYYDFVKPTFDTAASLLYTDTDSLILSIDNCNFYDIMKANLDRFDTSNYAADNPHNIPRSLPMLGRMKDEYAGKVIESFYGTGAKAYCVQLSHHCSKTAKGVKKYIIDKQLTVDDYKQIVEQGGVLLKKMYVFRSDYHTMFTELRNKVALSGKDDKRFILPDNTSTLAWGHYKIPELLGAQTLEGLLSTINNN